MTAGMMLVGRGVIDGSAEGVGVGGTDVGGGGTDVHVGGSTVDDGRIIGVDVDGGSEDDGVICCLSREAARDGGTCGVGGTGVASIVGDGGGGIT